MNDGIILSTEIKRVRKLAVFFFKVLEDFAIRVVVQIGFIVGFKLVVHWSEVGLSDNDASIVVIVVSISGGEKIPYLHWGSPL